MIDSRALESFIKARIKDALERKKEAIKLNDDSKRKQLESEIRAYEMILRVN